MKIKKQQIKIFNQYKLEMKRHTSVSPKKHGEWLAESNFIKYMNIAKNQNCAKQSCAKAVFS